MTDPWTRMLDFIQAQKIPAAPINAASDALSRIRNGLHSMAQKTAPPHLVLFEALNGLLVNKMLGLLAEWEIPDLIASQALTAEAIAKATETDPDAMARMLRALVSLGFLTQGPGKTFKNTLFSEILRKDHPQSMRETALMMSSDWYWEILKETEHTIKTGQSATEQVKGQTMFDFLHSDKKAMQGFYHSMTEYSNISGPFILQELDLTGVTRLCDVGGANGLLLANILTQHPRLSGVLFDLEKVTVAARETVRYLGLYDRMEVIDGSFFEAVPSGCDLYLLRAILHDWDDAACIAILANIRKAMPAHGKIVLIEKLIPEGSDYHVAKLMDIILMVTSTSGRERSEREFSRLAAHAGLRVNRIIPLPSLDNLIEIVKG